MIKLLVTTDFSANSRAGIRFALQFQKQTHCDLVFYHVVQIMKPTSWNDQRYKKLSAEKIEEFSQKLIDFVSKIKAEFPLSKGTSSYKVQIGVNAEENILHFAKANKSNFICIATKGAGKIQRLFGTTASALINQSKLPLFVIPGSYKPVPIQNIFYASDFSKLDSELQKVNDIAEQTKSKVNVYHYDYMLHVPELKIKLDAQAAKYSNKNVTFHFRRQEIESSLASHLKKELKLVKPNLVVLFTKTNKNWFERLFPSGESKALAFNTNFPLLVFRKKSKA